MKHKLLHDANGERTFALVLDPGENPLAVLTDFARAQKITAARVTGLGTFSRVTLGYFDVKKKDYKPIRVEQQVEVVSLIGNISVVNREPRLHAHVTIGRSTGAALAGHLLDASVNPTLELMVVASQATLERGEKDDGTGLSLLKP